MAWTVTLAPAARKSLKAIRDTRLRGRIVRALQGLEEEPRPSGAKRLVGLGGTLRIRVGNWRILYEVRGQEGDGANRADRATVGGLRAGGVRGMASQRLVERGAKAPIACLLFSDAGNPARGRCGGEGAGIRRLLRGGAGQPGDPRAALQAAADPVGEARAGGDAA